jgi:Uma2 family endonuclease
MAHDTNTLAPWAELVPAVGPMTIDELLARPEDDWLYELVEGKLVRMPPPGGEHGEIAGELFGALRDWVKPRGLGRVLAAETGFQLGPHTVLAGDAAFVRADRVPARGSAGRKRYWRLAPDRPIWRRRWPRRASGGTTWTPRRGRGWMLACGSSGSFGPRHSK